MRKKVLVILSFLFLVTKANAQISAISGTVGLVNSKARIQYEVGLSRQMSIGSELTYYFNFWTGPKIEFFSRYYFEKVSKGFFVQGKLGYGNLSQLNLLYLYASNERWSTFGGGAGIGYKLKPAKHFIIESVIGVHLYSAPYYNYKTGYDQFFIDNYLKTVNSAAWSYYTGLPVWVELKFGYQYKRNSLPQKIKKAKEEENLVEEQDDKADEQSEEKEENKTDKAEPTKK